MSCNERGAALIRCEWPGCGRTWNNWKQFANHRRIHDVSDLRRPVTASIVYYREPRAGARQLRAQVEIEGQFVHSVGFVEGEYSQGQASDDGLDMGDSASVGSDSEELENGPSRRSGDGGCPHDDESNNIPSFYFANVTDRTGAIFKLNLNASDSNMGGNSEMASELRGSGLQVMSDSEISVDESPGPNSIVSSRTLQEVTRQLVWNRVTEAESKQWLRLLKSEGFQSADLKNHSTLHSVMKTAELLEPHVQPLRVNIGVGEQIPN